MASPPPLQRSLFHQSRFPKHTLFLIVALVTALATAFFFHRNPKTLQSLRSIILDGTTIVLETVSSPFEKIHSVSQDFPELWGIKNTLHDVRAERDALLKSKDKLRSLVAENKTLRSLLTALPDPKIFYITARLIARHEGPFTHQFIIPTGKNHGIEKNQAVMAPGGLVGRTYDIGNNSSSIMTIYDSRSEIPIRIERTRERAIIKGHGNPNLEILYLNKETDDPIKEGDRLVTSGDGGLFPPSLLVGKITHIDATGKVWAQSIIQWSKLEFVRIAKKRPIS